MTGIIRVLIVDDHQSIIDGYLYRLQMAEDIEVVGTTFFGEEIAPFLEDHQVDVLLLDVNIPTSPQNPSPYPVLFFLPQLLKEIPDLHVIVISMHLKRSLIELAVEAGASGYILKEDHQAIESLVDVIRNVAADGVYFSDAVQRQMEGGQSTDSLLTPRQLQAISLCVAYPNETTADLAARMKIENSTMRNLLSQAYIRLGVRNRNAAVIEAQRRGII